MSSTDLPQARPADVELRLPADGAYVAVLRTTTAALAARLDFTLDDIEDLRMAISEAAGTVLEATAADAASTELTSRFWLGDRTITISVGTARSDVTGERSGDAPEVDESGFSWQVLSTLADDVRLGDEPGRFEIVLTLAATPLGAPL